MAGHWIYMICVTVQPYAGTFSCHYQVSSEICAECACNVVYSAMVLCHMLFCNCVLPKVKAYHYRASSKMLPHAFLHCVLPKVKAYANKCQHAVRKDCAQLLTLPQPHQSLQKTVLSLTCCLLRQNGLKAVITCIVVAERWQMLLQFLALSLMLVCLTFNDPLLHCYTA